MADIVVTIPKSRLAHVHAEEADVAKRLAAGEQGITYYWEMGRLPKERPERIYFCWDGAIRAYHDVLSMSFGRVYMSPEIHDLPEPLAMGPFRGFRYLKKEGMAGST